MPTDITDETAVQALFQRVEQSYSTVDVLVNNAGVSVGLTTIDEMDITEWMQNFVRPVVAVYIRLLTMNRMSMSKVLY